VCLLSRARLLHVVVGDDEHLLARCGLVSACSVAGCCRHGGVGRQVLLRVRRRTAWPFQQSLAATWFSFSMLPHSFSYSRIPMKLNLQPIPSLAPHSH
jgi:hypothetical protein